MIQEGSSARGSCHWLLRSVLAVVLAAWLMGGCESEVMPWLPGSGLVGAPVNNNNGSDEQVLGIQPEVPVGHPLAVPTNVRAGEVPHVGVQITWQDNSADEEGFRLARSQDGIDWTDVILLGPGITSYLDTAMSAGASLCYRVTAFSSSGLGESEQICLTPATSAGDASPESGNTEGGSAPSEGGGVPSDPGVIVPDGGSQTPSPKADAEPSDVLAADDGQGQIVLTWTDNTSAEAGFLIRRSTLAEGWKDYAVLPADTTVFTDVQVVTGTRYCYRVLAVQHDNTTLISIQSCVKLMSSVPAGGGSTDGGTGGSTGGGTGGSGGSTGGGTGGTTPDPGGTTPDPGGTTPDPTPDPGGTEPGGGTSPGGGTTDVENIDLLPVSLPGKPSGVTATTLSISSVRLTWLDNTSNELGFRIQRVSTQSNWLTEFRVAANTTQYTDTALASDVDYFYRVEAYTTSARTGGSRFTRASPEFDIAVYNGPLTQLTATTEAELIAASAASYETQTEILIDREIALQGDLWIGSNNSVVRVRGTTPSAGLRFTRVWDGNWSSPEATALNGLNNGSRELILENLRIRDYNWLGSAIKCQTTLRMTLKNCVFDNISSIVYPPKTIPVSESNMIWTANVIGGGRATTQLIIDGCTFSGSCLSSNYGHCIYATGRSVVIMNSTFTGSGSPVQLNSQSGATKRFTLVGNTYNQPGLVTVRGEFLSHPLMTNYPDHPTWFVFNKVSGSWGDGHYGYFTSGHMTIDRNDYSGMVVEKMWAYGYPYNINMAWWQGSGFDVNSRLPGQ